MNSRNRYRASVVGRIGARRIKGIIKMLLVFSAVMGVTLFCIRTFVTAAPNAETFCDGVYINNIPLSGLTYEQGVNLVRNSVKERLEHSSYTLTYQGKSWVFTPSEFDAELDLDEEIQLAWNFGHVGSDSERRASAKYAKQNTVNYQKDITFDEIELEKFIDRIKYEVDVEPVSASVTVGSNEILTINPSSEGVRLSATKLKTELMNAIYSGDNTPIELKPDIVAPEYTTEQLQNNTEHIVSYSTTLKYSSSQRNKNVWRALSRFNGFVVKPGEKVSFNTVVGKRTLENGFFTAPEFDGSSVIDGVGGGTCQASSTLYAALLMADIDVDVRYNHTMAVNYCKASFDAAVSDTGKDLVFTNNLDFPIYIYTSCDNEAAYVNIYGPPSKYDIVLDSKKTQIFEPKGYKKVRDKSGKHAWYTTDLVLKKEGKNGGRSYAWRSYYDKETGELVDKQEFANDTYNPLKPEYYVGIHSLDEPRPKKS